MTEQEEALALLDLVDPSQLDYDGWLNAGKALKSCGLPCSEWDSWSQLDNRYTAGECERKWKSFKGGGITKSTLASLAKEQGRNVNFGTGGEYFKNTGDDDDMSLDSVIGGSSKGDHQIIDKNWIKEKEIPPCPENWNPNNDLINYLLTLFKPHEMVAYTMESFQPENSEKWLPKKGVWRTCQELITSLKSSNDPISSYNKDVGSWIRVNPFDGNGVSDENVTDFRYALIESDDISLEKQYYLLQQLELPIATLVHSGSKSLHALVKIDAPTYDEYKKRVDYLYAICAKNSFSIDEQNRNPSRLSRMPGVMRGDKPQYLIATNMGKDTWEEWKEWIEDLNDNLPEMESLADSWDNPPPLADEIIHGILRKGHKLLIAGPSKAGKSWNLIQLCIAIAEGGWWNGWKCEQGQILYVNLELDKPSCLNRFKTVYERLGIDNPHINNIDIWNLRGKAIPMDKLAPKLIRRALKKRYIAIVIDPIYKVITGDENSAEQMGHFCNQFDKICTELKVSTIYSHHHSKGLQGGKKSGDRASGSGVFLRDPDAYIDLMPLDKTEEIQKEIDSVLVCAKIKSYMDVIDSNWYHQLTPDERIVPEFMRMEAEKRLGNNCKNLPGIINDALQTSRRITCWRIEATLREFADPDKVNMFFAYPTHEIDHKGILTEALAEGEETWKTPEQKIKEHQKNKEASKKRKQDAQDDLLDTFRKCHEEEPVTLATIAEVLGVSTRTARRKIVSHPKLKVNNNLIEEKE